MLKYNVRTYPMTFTNDFPVVKREIVAKKISPDKIIRRIKKRE